MKTIKEWRKLSGFSIKEAADKLGIETETLSSWELGLAFPSIERAKDCAELYGVTLNDITFLKPEDGTELQTKCLQIKAVLNSLMACLCDNDEEKGDDIALCGVALDLSDNLLTAIDTALGEPV